MRRILFVNILILLVFGSMTYWSAEKEKLEAAVASGEPAQEENKDYIKWVDFGVSKFALSEAYEYDRDTYGTDSHIGWIDLLAWTASYTGGAFGDDRAVCQYMNSLKEKVDKGQKLSDLVKDLEYFPYYQEAYSAVLGGMVGEYEIEVPVDGKKGKKTWEKRYGLKAFSPIAKGFPYNDYDDLACPEVTDIRGTIWDTI